MNLPNKLTVLRVIMVPLSVLCCCSSPLFCPLTIGWVSMQDLR